MEINGAVHGETLTKSEAVKAAELIDIEFVKYMKCYGGDTVDSLRKQLEDKLEKKRKAEKEQAEKEWAEEKKRFWKWTSRISLGILVICISLFAIFKIRA